MLETGINQQNGYTDQLLNNSIEQRVEANYANSAQTQQRATDAFNMWTGYASMAAQYGYQAYSTSLDAAKAMISGANTASSAMNLAAAQAGISASSIYSAEQQNLHRDQAIGLNRIGQEKVAFAGSGLQATGSAQLIMRETVDQSLNEARYNFLTMASQEAAQRQQQQNLQTQANQTQMTARTQANATIEKGFFDWQRSAL